MHTTPNQKARKKLLVIEYSMKNISSRTLYIFDPDPPYVLISKNGDITFGLFWLPVPPDMDVEVVEKPGVIELPPSITRKGKFNITIPIQTDLPYDLFDVNKPPLEFTSATIRMAVGFVQKETGENLTKSYCRGKLVESLSVEYSRQQFVSSEPTPIKVPVKLRVPTYVPPKSNVTSTPLSLSFTVESISDEL